MQININWKSAAALVVFLVWFFYCTWFGLATKLGYDDVMNITFAWEPPLTTLLLSILSPFTALYRPTGSLVYRTMFEAFGLNPLPFRILAYTLLLLNLSLAYRLVVRLGGTKEVAALTVLLCAYHGRLWAIFLNNGTLYDVLCGTLSLGFLLYYVSVRLNGGLLGMRALITGSALFILAINAKEMAACLPLVVLTFEAVYFWPGPRAPVRVIARQVALALICTAIAGAAALAKTGSGSVMHGNPPYAFTVTARQFLDHWRLLMSDLVYAKGKGLTEPQMLVIWLAVIAVVIILRKRYVTVIASLALLGPLPVIFIPYRGFFVMYLPLFGWAVLVAAVIVDVSNWIWRRIGRRPPPGRALLLFAVVSYLIVSISSHDSASKRRSNDPGQEVITSTTKDILELAQPLPPGAHILFLHDRFPPDALGTLMITRLLYNDPQLSVDRPTLMNRPPDPAAYDCVFDYANNHLVVVETRSHPGNSWKNYPD